MKKRTKIIIGTSILAAMGVGVYLLFFRQTKVEAARSRLNIPEGASITSYIDSDGTMREALTSKIYMR